jgi:hypothetical protein
MFNIVSDHSDVVRGVSILPNRDHIDNSDRSVVLLWALNLIHSYNSGSTLPILSRIGDDSCDGSIILKYNSVNTSESITLYDKWRSGYMSPGVSVTCKFVVRNLLAYAYHNDKDCYDKIVHNLHLSSRGELTPCDSCDIANLLTYGSKIQGEVPGGVSHIARDIISINTEMLSDVVVLTTPQFGFNILSGISDLFLNIGSNIPLGMLYPAMMIGGAGSLALIGSVVIPRNSVTVIPMSTNSNDDIFTRAAEGIFTYIKSFLRSFVD